MEIVRFADAASYEPQEGWKRTSLCSRDELSIEHFVKPPGHVSPRHEHPNAQVLILLQGRLEVEAGDGGKEVLEAGDAAYIPGGEAHVVRNLLDLPAVGLDLFMPGRSFDFWLRRAQP